VSKGFFTASVPGLHDKQRLSDGMRSQVVTSRYSSDLFGLAYPKAFISKIRCYDNGDRTYPHRDLPAANKHHPFEDEPQGVNDRDDKKNRSRKLRKRILAQLS
jgi:hypothetical protein